MIMETKSWPLNRLCPACSPQLYLFTSDESEPCPCLCLHPCQHLEWSVSLILAILTSVWWYRTVVLICLFLVTFDVPHFLNADLPFLHLPSLAKGLFESFVRFLSCCLLLSSLLCCETSLYKQDRLYFYDWQVFSPSLWPVLSSPPQCHLKSRRI